MIIIDNVRIFDGRGVIEAGSVEFEAGAITYVGPPGGSGLPARDRVDGAGGTLLPGLIDAHTHTFGSVENLQLALAFGVTTELDMFLFPPERTRSLCAEAAGRTDVADLRSAGAAAGAAGGLPSVAVPGVPALSGPADAEPFVAARQEEGAHFLKIIIDDGANHGTRLPALAAQTVAALVAAARDRAMVTVAHVSALWSVEIAVNAGVDVLTHLPLEAPLERDLVERILAAGCAVNPTLAILQMATDPARGRLLAADERIARRLPAAALAAITEGREGLACPHPSPDQDVAKAIQSVARLHRAGVPILAGTDANNAPGRACPIVHGASLHAELALLVAAGLTPAEALAAATSVPARRFGLADRGRIAPGLRADLLLVDGDPTAEITATRSVAGVWRQGVRCDPADVLSADALLAHEGSHR